MHIETITLRNFRCFGDEATTVGLGTDITALIGGNGAGKSSFIEALRRLFGISRDERTLTRSDVHFGPAEKPETVVERQIVLDVVLAFPELATGDPTAASTVPEVFRVMTADGPGKPLKARLRLEAVWKFGESFVDDIDTAIYWVSHLNNVAFGDEGGASLDKQRLSSSDRNKIRLIYVPATRDGSAVTRQALRQLLHRIERSADFDPATEQEIQDVSENLQTKITGLPAIDWVTNKLTENWGRLHASAHLSQPRLVVLTQEFTQLLRSLTAKLSPTPEGRERGLDELSEGQTSLFFIALAATLAQLGSTLAKGPLPDGFGDLDIMPPALTIYAVEEPENHLAPFYLSRLMSLLGELCASSQAMGLVTSHAPGVLRRVDPEDVRHFRLDLAKLVTRVSPIILPDDDDDASKFVRGAVLAQPEIYFANLVILGEGDSEAIVLPRVAKALGIELDPSFVAFAPLGGRHVNHFWRLLNGLKIPSLTLLDFDLGRYGAGPLRFKYAYDQLRAFRGIQKPDWVKGDPLTSAYWKPRPEASLNKWRTWFGTHGIFYSHPLDLDMMMVRALPDAYGVDAAKTYSAEDEAALEKSVYGKGAGKEAYEGATAAEDYLRPNELACYDAMFKNRGKPGSHLMALGALSDKEIAEACPPPLKKLIEAANTILSIGSPKDATEA